MSPDKSRRFQGGPERLRSPARLALLEVPRVLGLCLAEIEARKVLDLGTGSGVFAEAFAEKGLEVTGVDVNPGMLVLAREAVPQGRFLEAEAESLPFEDGAFDLVFLGQVLHEATDALAVLREARRVARVRVAVLEWAYREGEAGPPLGHRLSAATISGLAAQAGFTQVATESLETLVLYTLRP